jgi:hypothetical protein
MRIAHPQVAALGLGAALIGAAAPAATAFPKGEFFIQRAKLSQRPDGSWSGPGKLDGIRGRLTITGPVVLLQQERHVIHWTWVAGRRRVAGCSSNQVISRPNGVQLWDGNGRITSASEQERRYRGRRVSLYGPTRRDDLTHAQISVAEFHPSIEMPAHACR